MPTEPRRRMPRFTPHSLIRKSIRSSIPQWDIVHLFWFRSLLRWAWVDSSLHLQSIDFSSRDLSLLRKRLQVRVWFMAMYDNDFRLWSHLGHRVGSHFHVSMGRFFTSFSVLFKLLFSGLVSSKIKGASQGLVCKDVRKNSSYGRFLVTRLGALFYIRMSCFFRPFMGFGKPLSWGRVLLNWSIAFQGLVSRGCS